VAPPHSPGVASTAAPHARNAPTARASGSVVRAMRARSRVPMSSY
jgi:hypothetical protein